MLECILKSSPISLLIHGSRLLIMSTFKGEDKSFDKAFGLESPSSSRNVVPETQVVEGTAADVTCAADAILRLNNTEGYLSDDLHQYEEVYAQPPAKFSPLSSSSHRSSRSASACSSSSVTSRSSASSYSADPSLPLTTAEIKKKKAAAAAAAVAAANKRRKDAVAAAEKEREATMITPVAVPDSIAKEVASRRRSCSVGGRMDLEEKNEGSGKRRIRKTLNGKGRASRLSPQFEDVSDNSFDSEMSHPSVTKENTIDRLVVAYIGSKKCLNAESKRTLLARMIKEPSNIYFSRERGVHLEDIFSRNEDSAAKAGRWGIPFVSSALFRLSKAIQQEDEDESSKLRQRSAAAKILRLVHTARHKVLSELEEKKEQKLREKEKAKKRINSAAGRKHHGLTFDRDRVSLFLYIIFILLELISLFLYSVLHVQRVQMDSRCRCTTTASSTPSTRRLSLLLRRS